MNSLDIQPLTVTILGEERRLVLLACSHLAVENPNWRLPTMKLAEKLHGLDWYDEQRLQYQELLSERLRLAVDIRARSGPRAYVPSL